MRLIDSSVSLIDPHNILNPFIKIEQVGRTCYKSTSDLTEETAKKFYHNLVARQHTAMLEHVNFVFQVSDYVFQDVKAHKYFNYSIEELDNGSERYLVSANLRALNESKEEALLSVLARDIDPDLVYVADINNKWEVEDDECKLVDIDSIEDIQKHAYKKHKYLSYHFICDRGVSHEIVRHRPASYAQESTRYCNYSKDKFGGEITYIKPADWDNYSDKAKRYYKYAWREAETDYDFLVRELGHTPQQARAVLPNALKTEIIMTANCEEFDHFFNLRSKGTTGAPHPDMKRVADMAYSLYCDNTKFTE